MSLFVLSPTCSWSRAVLVAVAVHYGSEQSRIKTEAQCHSLISSLVHLRRSLIRLLRCTHLFAHSTTASRALGKMNDEMSQNDLFLSHSAVVVWRVKRRSWSLVIGQPNARHISLQLARSFLLLFSIFRFRFFVLISFWLLFLVLISSFFSNSFYTLFLCFFVVVFFFVSLFLSLRLRFLFLSIFLSFIFNYLVSLTFFFSVPFFPFFLFIFLSFFLFFYLSFTLEKKNQLDCAEEPKCHSGHLSLSGKADSRTPRWQSSVRVARVVEWGA